MSEPEQCGCRPPIECPYQYLQPTKTALWGEQWRDYALGLEADLAAERARVERLLEVVKGYAVHRPGCAKTQVMQNGMVAKCDCGGEAALAEPPSSKKEA